MDVKCIFIFLLNIHKSIHKNPTNKLLILKKRSSRNSSRELKCYFCNNLKSSVYQSERDKCFYLMRKLLARRGGLVRSVITLNSRTGGIQNNSSNAQTRSNSITL